MHRVLALPVGLRCHRITHAINIYAGLLALAILASTAPSAELQSTEFLSIFNGSDLSGWRGDKDVWTVRDGALTAANGTNNWLVWTNEVDDFELHFAFRVERGVSGVLYRAKDLGNRLAGFTYEIQDITRPGDCGDLFENGGKGSSGQFAGRGKLASTGTKVIVESTGRRQPNGTLPSAPNVIRAATKHGDWNEAVIIAKGNQLIHQLNGHVAVEVLDLGHRLPRGLLAFRVLGRDTVVQFKNIRIKRLRQ